MIMRGKYWGTPNSLMHSIDPKNKNFTFANQLMVPKDFIFLQANGM